MRGVERLDGGLLQGGWEAIERLGIDYASQCRVGGQRGQTCGEEWRCRLVAVSRTDQRPANSRPLFRSALAGSPGDEYPDLFSSTGAAAAAAGLAGPLCRPSQSSAAGESTAQ